MQQAGKRLETLTRNRLWRTIVWLCWIVRCFHRFTLFSLLFDAVDLIQLVIKFYLFFFSFSIQHTPLHSNWISLAFSPRRRSHESMKMQWVTWCLLWQVFAYNIFLPSIDIFISFFFFAFLRVRFSVFESLVLEKFSNALQFIYINPVLRVRVFHVTYR